MDRAIWIILILLQISVITVSSREFFLDNQAIFAKCLNAPPGSKDITEISDLSKLSSKKGKDGLHISGNITTLWEVDPHDRVEVNIAVLKMDRGNWKPTAIAANVRDFCKEMYEKNTLYYPYSTKYIANKQEIKEKCLTHKGTLILVEPFNLRIILSPAVPLTPGPHRVIIKFTSVNKAGVPNPNSVCFEIPGNLV